MNAGTYGLLHDGQWFIFFFQLRAQTFFVKAEDQDAGWFSIEVRREEP